ncbi:hypothetical protein GCM10027072_77730 [Streptomyces bullii]
MEPFDQDLDGEVGRGQMRERQGQGQVRTASTALEGPQPAAILETRAVPQLHRVGDGAGVVGDPF